MSQLTSLCALLLRFESRSLEQVNHGAWPALLSLERGFSSLGLLAFWVVLLCVAGTVLCDGKCGTFVEYLQCLILVVGL